MPIVRHVLCTPWFMPHGYIGYAFSSSAKPIPLFGHLISAKTWHLFQETPINMFAITALSHFALDVIFCSLNKKRQQRLISLPIFVKYLKLQFKWVTVGLLAECIWMKVFCIVLIAIWDNCPVFYAQGRGRNNGDILSVEIVVYLLVEGQFLLGDVKGWHSYFLFHLCCMFGCQYLIIPNVVVFKFTAYRLGTS